MTDRVLVVVAGVPARASCKMVLPPEVEVLVPPRAGEWRPALAFYDRILVQRGVDAEGMDLAAHLAIGGTLHVLDTLPDIVADALFPSGVVSSMEDTYRRLVKRA